MPAARHHDRAGGGNPPELDVFRSRSHLGRGGGVHNILRGMTDHLTATRPVVDRRPSLCPRRCASVQDVASSAS